MNHFTIYTNIEDYSKDMKVLDDLMGIKNKPDKTLNRIIRLESKIEVLNRGIELVDMSDVEETILNCRMDGLGISQIANHIGIARATVRNRLDKISKSISQAINESGRR